MKYKIEESKDRLDISVNDTDNKKEKLLEAFQECQQGRCSCPTEEYKKLDSLEIEENEEGIKLHLKSKPGTKMNPSEIQKCMEYTTKKVEKK